MRIIQGTGVSAGIAVGTLRFFRRGSDEIERRHADDAAAERNRFADAQARAIEELGALAEKARDEAGDDAALLFETHQLMAEDLDYVEAIEALMDSGLSAEAAVSDTAEQFADMFTATGDDYMMARAADVKDVSRRILGILQGKAGDIAVDGEPFILAADDLSPSETVQLDKTKLLGFVTAGGSASGHTAILARTMGIPAVIGAKDTLAEASEGAEVILDGGEGKLYLDPDPQTREGLLQKQAEERIAKNAREALRGAESVTLDGQKMRVFCNIGSAADVAAVLENDGEGVGLFRSEFLYLSREDYPDEETLFQAYRSVLSAMDGKQVIIRTLDIGADKQVGYFGLEKEENPAMGMRAIRICLTRPEVFRTQLRALYRASAYGNLGIMFPMVTSEWELQECKDVCRQVREELAAEGKPFDPAVELGIMVETPAAVLISDRLAREADFFSIGTNDLTQYTLACDRQNHHLERFHDPHHPAVLRAIRTVTENAHRCGKWVGICGELGADPALTELFLAMGVDELSVTPGNVLPLREKIRSIRVSDIREALLSELDG